jgi:hypothetical protein
VQVVVVAIEVAVAWLVQLLAVCSVPQVVLLAEW